MKNFKGNLLDICDIHKWNYFHKIVYIGLNHDKIRILKERVSKLNIKNHVIISKNNIQGVQIKETF